MLKKHIKISAAAISLAALYFAAASIFSNPEIPYSPENAVSLKSLAQPQRSPASGSRGLDVIIDVGQVAYLDESTNIDTLIINGELHCDEARAPETLELRVKEIQINGVFQCGTTTQPYRKKLIISLKNSNLDPKVDEGYRGINVEHGGKLILNGERKNAGWYKLNQTVAPGAQSIVLDVESSLEDPAVRFNKKTSRPLVRGLPWKVGDEIVIGPTGYNYAEAEKFTITGIGNNAPYAITLDHPVQFQHWGESQIYNNTIIGSFNLDERAEVANLTRSILIRADEADGAIDEGTGALAQRGGHIMVHSGGSAYIDSIELYKMGQAGVMARYPFHWHWVGDAPGQYIKNSSIHHSYQRCITIHRTNKTLVQNNTCFDFKGHGYFMEDGNEVDNKILNNLAIMAKPPSANKLLLASDNLATSEGQGRFPSVSCFWITNPKNTIKFNVASGCIGTGFWMSFESEVKDLSGNIVATPIKEVTTEFSYNTAHATKVGITWDGAPAAWLPLTGNPNNPNDRNLTSAHYHPPNVPVFTGLKAYKNYLTGIYFRGQSVIFKNNIIADNGWSYWVSYNQIVKDSVFIGKTNNDSPAVNDFFYEQSYDNGRSRKTGIVIYDGPFEVHHSDFIDFSTQVETRNTSQGPVNSTIIPFTSTGGTNKFTNVVSRLRFIPEPVHRVHNYSAEEDERSRFVLGNAVIRDLDGSLSNTGMPSVVTGNRSLGVTAQSQCQDGGTSLYQFKVCPGSYHEGSFAFLRWGISAWATPFLVRRNDGAINYYKSEWSMFPYQAPNNLFATISNQDYTYELLPYFQYELDRIQNAKTTIDGNHELDHVNAPIVKIIAYGNNCKLFDQDHPENNPLKTNTLEDLKRMNQTSFYSSGEDFYVRIIPDNKWDVIADSPLVSATAYTTMPTRYRISCDQGYIEKKVLGKIEQVVRGNTSTTISGWACNYTHSSSIKVKLYAKGPTVRTPATTLVRDTLTYIAEMMSNQSSDESVAFKCGKFSTNGRAFTFNIPNTELAKFTNHSFYVKGISNSGGQDLFIDGSGKYKVLQRYIEQDAVNIRESN